jgi:LPS-assembly protein
MTHISSGKFPLFISVFFLCTVYCLLTADCCFSDDQTVITSETLIYDQKERIYTAKGNVTIQRAGTVIEADEVTYNEQTSDMGASGNVRYHDDDVAITAARADLNLESGTGTIFDAALLYKKDNYHIAGREIRKTGNDYFFSPEATFTTCDAPVPAWCFKGRNMDAAVGNRLIAKDVVFRIKDVPVLYTPVLWAPILTERKTGFLFPFVGYSDSRGLQVTIPFYWVLSESQDATFVLDDYSKRGLGTGLEYRYVGLDNMSGQWWGYHIRDRELSKNFFELRARHDQRSAEGLGGYLNINYVNENDFYREFKTDLQVRTNRFLESTGEISIPFTGSRAYLLSQYWIDLKDDAADPLQRLPEAGYVLNPTKSGPVWLSGSFALANFWREEGIYGQRMDVFPRITHSFGDDITILQSLGLRETAYSLKNSEDSTPHRESLVYSISGNLRLLKKFESFSHILEPTLSYTFVSNSENSLPLFDSAELLKRLSLIEFSLLNRIVSDQEELMVFRISQGFDSYGGDRPFVPLLFDIGLKRPLPLRLGAAYNVHTGDIESLHSDITMKIADITFQAGQHYNRLNDVNTYVLGMGIHPFTPLTMNGHVWYDAEQRETREININLIYMSQCWGINIGYTKRPDDYSISFLIELKGITKALKI